MWNNIACTAVCGAPLLISISVDNMLKLNTHMELTPRVTLHSYSAQLIVLGQYYMRRQPYHKLYNIQYLNIYTLYGKQAYWKATGKYEKDFHMNNMPSAWLYNCLKKIIVCAKWAVGGFPIMCFANKTSPNPRTRTRTHTYTHARNRTHTDTVATGKRIHNTMSCPTNTRHTHQQNNALSIFPFNSKHSARRARNRYVYPLWLWLINFHLTLLVSLCVCVKSSIGDHALWPLSGCVY